MEVCRLPKIPRANIEILVGYINSLCDANNLRSNFRFKSNSGYSSFAMLDEKSFQIKFHGPAIDSILSQQGTSVKSAHAGCHTRGQGITLRFHGSPVVFKMICSSGFG